MLQNNENENIFKFDKIELANYPNYSSKTKVNFTTSPSSYPFVRERRNSIDSVKHAKKKNNIKHLKYIASIILIIYLILFFDFDDIQPYKINQDMHYEAILEEIPKIDKETFKFREFNITKTYLTYNIINKFNSYIDICMSNKLIDNNKYPLTLNPKLSIIMPIYKGGKYLYYSLRSIQNQNMKDIEIILIDDNSPDETLSIIGSYIKEDQRIRLIKNEVNRKVLYSKSIGALNSKGKYIIQLDQDDIFIRDDLFDIIYYEAEGNNLDLLQFRDITKNNFHFNKKSIVNCIGRHYIYPKNNQYKEQPELKDTLYIDNNVFLLWGLLIRADIYKEAIYKLWKIIVNYKIIFHEDYMITFMFAILSKNYKYINKFGLIHLNHRLSASNNHWKIKKYYLSILFFANNLYDYHIKDNPKDVKLALNFMHLSKLGFIKGRELYPSLFNLFMEKIINNNYLSYEDIIFLENNFQIKNNHKPFLDSYEFLSIQNYQNSSNISIGNEICPIDIKISIIIICDEYKYLNKTINSIENQNFTDYEIILVYDGDNTYNLNLILKYINLFCNIKLVENYGQKGYLFSISEGVLSSKGKYILTLEPGYVLANNNTLNEIFSEINKTEIDVLEFGILVNKDESMLKNNLYLYKCQHFESKTRKEIFSIKYNKDFMEIDLEKDLIYNKLIKANLYKSLIRKYKLNDYENIIYNYYNDIIIFILEKNNSIFKQINYHGIIQNTKNVEDLKNNGMKNNNNTQKIKDSIFYINFIYDNSYNTTEDKEKVLNNFINILSKIYNKSYKITRESQELYEQFLNCKYISQFSKRNLKLYYYSLLN